MTIRRALFAAPFAVLILGSLTGCPARGNPTCPDCRLLAAGDCGLYTLEVNIVADGGEAGPVTSPKLVITWEKDGSEQTSSKVLSGEYSTLNIGQTYNIEISKADFPELCDPKSGWSTAKPTLQGAQDGKTVEFPVTIK